MDYMSIVSDSIKEQTVKLCEYYFNNIISQYGIKEVLQRLRDYCEPAFFHNVHVCKRVIMIGIIKNYPEKQITEMGTAGILLDVGYIRIQREYLGKQTSLSETEFEVSTCKEKTGLSPVEYLCDLGVYDYGGGAFHCVHMSEHDLDLFQEKHLNIITNPASNLKLASGIAPIQSMLQRNINVCLGTDGAASNNCLDMFREMFLVTGLAKYKNCDASAVDAYEVLKMATVNGAKALNLNCGVLEAGKLADLIILDLHQPNMQPMNNIAKNIVYSGSKSNVKCTMVNGEILYEDGHFHVGFDMESLYDEVQKRVERLMR